MTLFILNILAQILGLSLEELENNNDLINGIKFFNPPLGYLTIEEGIYIIIQGRIRLLDSEGNQLNRLEKGNYFGNFLPNFANYKVRASENVQLGFIPSQILSPYLNNKDDDNLSYHLKKTESEIPQSSEQLTSSNQDENSERPYFPSPTQKVGRWWHKVVQGYPFFAQQSTSDCGVACMVMIGRYWGKRFSVNRLRDLAYVHRNGATLKGLVAVAESLGFATRAGKATLEGLEKQILPAIAHWEGNHYIVVYAITKKKVIIADPAIGQLTLSRQEFIEKWTGYSIILEPTFRFNDTPEHKSTFWQFFELVKPHWNVLLEVLVASIFLQIFGLVTPIFTQLILDRVVVQGSELTLWAMGLGLIIFGVFRVMLTGLRTYLLDHTANKIDLALIVGFIYHTLRLPLNFFESRYVGDIISRVEENKKIRQFLSGEALMIILDILTVFIYVGMMFKYSWKLGGIALVIVPPFMLLAVISTPFLQKISREIFKASAKENSYLIEVLTGIRTIKAMSVEQTVRWHWENLMNQEIKNSFSGQVIGNQMQLVSNLIETLANTGLLWYGAHLVIKQELSIGGLVAFQMLFGHILSPFQRLTVLWNQFQEVNIAVERINDVLETKPEEDLQCLSRQSIPSLQGQIKFKKVTFRYHRDSDRNVLENLSFEIEAGQTVALVGRSGSGKTTISKLLLGLYLPTNGKILIDGYDLTTISLNSLRQQIGVVDQDTFLFGATIRENISLGNPEITLPEIIKATKLAGAHEFIQSLPMAYETQIGEGGGMLSGGQRQRLAIARALLGNPKLLILDEATSHLDTESERIIQTNFHQIRQGKTTVIIAHRLSTIRNADLILVLDQGILVESGTHENLMAQRGHYYYLNHQQIE